MYGQRHPHYAQSLCTRAFQEILVRVVRVKRKKVLLMHRSIQVSVQEKGFGAQEEQSNTSGIDENDGPESSGITDELTDDTTQKNAKSHSYIP